MRKGTDGCDAAAAMHPAVAPESMSSRGYRSRLFGGGEENKPPPSESMTSHRYLPELFCRGGGAAGIDEQLRLPVAVFGSGGKDKPAPPESMTSCHWLRDLFCCGASESMTSHRYLPDLFCCGAARINQQLL